MRVILLNHYERLSPRVALEAHSLNHNGYDIALVSWCRDPKQSSVLASKVDSFPVRWIAISASKGSSRLLFALPALYKQVWRLLKVERFDLVHCTHLFLLPIALFSAKRRNARVIYDAYERYAADIADYYVPWVKSFRRLIEIMENVLVKRVDAVLTISSANEALEKRYKKCCKTVEVLYNVPFSLPPVNERQIRELKGLYKGRDIMCYVGGLVKDRGLFKLVDVLDTVRKEFPNILLLLIGDFGSLVEKEALLEKVRKIRLEPYIEIIPWMPYNDMFQYLKISHVGVAPHQQEKRFKLMGKGCGRKFFTYMHAGLPIVSTNFGEIAKVVEEEGCGLLVDCSSTRAIANAVMFLLGNKNVAKEMGENGRRTILGKYNWEKESEKLIKVYKEVLN